MSEQESEIVQPLNKQSDLPEQESTWPKKIGIISLIYAVGGLLCQVGIGLSAMASEWLMKLAKMEVEIPTIIKLTGGATAVLATVLGIVMLTGSIKLLRRQQSGISLLKTWSALRLVVVLLALVVGIITMPAQIEMQRSIAKQTNIKLREAGQGSKSKEFNEEATLFRLKLTAVIGAGVFSIYPLFLGLYLSRKKINEEIKFW